MICLDFEWQTNEFMVYCRTTQLREKSMTENLWGYIAFYIALRYNDCATQILYFHLASVHFYFGKNAGSVFVRLQRGNEFVSQQ